jgi:CheY-like chemotaxis protein
MVKKILIVDDNPAILDTLRRMLGTQGYEVREAANGLIAMEMLKQDTVDLVITDYIMRGMDGIELIEEIHVQWPTIPLVLLTACLSVESAKTMLRGRAHYLSKPVSLMELLTTIRQLLPSLLLTLQAIERPLF